MFLPVFEANFSNVASDVPGEKKRNKEEIEKNKNKKKISETVRPTLSQLY